MRPFYVKDTNDFILRYLDTQWCISRDLSLLNVEMCLPYFCDKVYCPNYQDYIEKGKAISLCEQWGNWFSPNGKIYEDESLTINCFGESIKTPENPNYD